MPKNLELLYQKMPSKKLDKCLPDYRMIQTLCNALRVTIPELMDGEGAAKNRVQELIFGLLMGLSIADILADIIIVG